LIFVPPQLNLEDTMVNETNSTKKKPTSKTVPVSSGTYGLGLIGALIYFLEHAESFGDGALGVLKALFWPAPLVYKLLDFLQM
jgi:hypothetical protein